MIKATKHTPPLVHADVKMKVLSEGSAAEERSESKSTERKEKKAGTD